MTNTLFTKNRVILSLLLILFVAATLYSLNQFFLYTPDSARYVAWANSLSHFNGFTDDTAPEAKRYMVHSPLYSLLLAPIAFLFPDDVVKLKSLNILLSVFTMVFLFKLLKKKHDNITPLLIVAMFVVHPVVHILSTQILTEVLFGCGFIALMYFLQNELQENSTPLNFVMTMVSLIVCIFSREIGVLCVPIVLAFYAVRKSYTKTILVFFIPLILYGVWFIRNEIYYANVEQTQFKNSLIFFTNTMTSSDTSFGIEMLSRVVQSAAYYLKEVTILMFTPVYDVFEKSLNTPWMALVNSRLPIMKISITVVKNIYWVLSVISICLVVAGMIIEYLFEKTFYIKIVFLILYVGIVLVYPVLDSRFLYPVFLLALVWSGSTISYLWKLNNRVIRTLLIGLIVVLSAPNIVWTVNFVDAQHKLIKDPLGSFVGQKNGSQDINIFQIVLPLGGEWLNKINDSSVIIISPYKELTFNVKNKKIFVLTRTTPVSAFNQVIQDYNVSYVLSKKDPFGWRDYEVQFEWNDQYDFQLTFDSGAVEIYKVLPKNSIDHQTGIFTPLITAMKNKDYKGADEFFVKNKKIVDYHADLLYLKIVNKQNLGQLDSASGLLERLYSKPQGLAYTRLAAIHQTLIERRALLDRTPYSEYRSNILMNLGITFWQLDMKDLSLKYYKQCIEEDSTAALAYVYRIIFSIEEHDTLTAQKTYQRLRAVFPEAELTEKIDSLMNFHAIYRKAGSSKQKAEVLEEIFDRYKFLGFTTTAMSVAKKALQYDPERISIYKKLGFLYEKENEYFPALVNLNQFTVKNDHDPDVISMLANIKRKLYLVP